LAKVGSVGTPLSDSVRALEIELAGSQAKVKDLEQSQLVLSKWSGNDVSGEADRKMREMQMRCGQLSDELEEWRERYGALESEMGDWRSVKEGLEREVGRLKEQVEGKEREMKERLEGVRKMLLGV
jgi:predicted  nucleic acid-binding Zn-ribbon protein